MSLNNKRPLGHLPFKTVHQTQDLQKVSVYQPFTLPNKRVHNTCTRNDMLENCRFQYRCFFFPLINVFSSGKDEEERMKRNK